MESSIKRLRTQSGISAIELAKQLGVSKAALYAWESGETTPSAENLLKISKVFGVAPDQILNFERVDTDLSTAESQVITLFRSLQSKDKELMLNLLSALARNRE